MQEEALGAPDTWQPASCQGSGRSHITAPHKGSSSPPRSVEGVGQGQARPRWLSAPGDPEGTEGMGQGRYEVPSPGARRVWAPRRAGLPAPTTSSMAPTALQHPRATALLTGLPTCTPFPVLASSWGALPQPTASVLVRDAEKGQKTLQPHCRAPASLCSGPHTLSASWSPRLPVGSSSSRGRPHRRGQADKKHHAG